MLKRSLRFTALAACTLGIVLLIGVVATATRAEESTPVFGNVIVALDYSHTTLKPIDSLATYPAGVKGIVALLPIQNAPSGGEIDSQWYRNGEPASNVTKSSVTASDTVIPAKVTSTGGLAAGDWEIHYLYQGKTIASATFKVEDVPMVFALDFGEDHSEINLELINPGTNFPSKSVNISAVFRYMNIPMGSTLDGQWLVDDSPLSTSTLQLTDPSGNGVFNVSNPNGLADGIYELRISLNGKVLQSGKVTVGGSEF